MAATPAKPDERRDGVRVPLMQRDLHGEDCRRGPSMISAVVSDRITSPQRVEAVRCSRATTDMPDDGRRLVADAESSRTHASQEIGLLGVEEVALVPIAYRRAARGGYQQRRADGPVRELQTFVGSGCPRPFHSSDTATGRRARPGEYRLVPGRSTAHSGVTDRAVRRGSQSAGQRPRRRAPVGRVTGPVFRC